MNINKQPKSFLPPPPLSKREKEAKKVIQRLVDYTFDEALRSKRLLKTPWGVLTWTTKKKNLPMTATEIALLKRTK